MWRLGEGRHQRWHKMGYRQGRADMWRTIGGWVVVPPYPIRPGGRTEFGVVDQFYHIYIFEYCKNKCRIIVSVKEGPPFC